MISKQMKENTLVLDLDETLVYFEEVWIIYQIKERLWELTPVEAFRSTLFARN
jgi:phosphoserine phosphatase